MKKESDFTQLDIRTLGYYIDRALCVMVKRLNKELTTENLKLQHSDFTIMKILSQKDGLNQSEIARYLGKERSGISRSLIALEHEGYIVREAVNGCTNKVMLTEKGKEIVPLLNRIADKITDRAFTGFSQKKRDKMMKDLTAVYLNSL